MLAGRTLGTLDETAKAEKPADLEQALADLAVVVRGMLDELRALNQRQSELER